MGQSIIEHLLNRIGAQNLPARKQPQPVNGLCESLELVYGFLIGHRERGLELQTKFRCHLPGFRY